MMEATAALPDAQPAILVPPLAEPPPTVAAAPPTVDEIRAVDQAFASPQEKADAMAGLMGLYLTAPWLADLLIDHFRKPRDEEEDLEPRPAPRACC